MASPVATLQERFGGILTWRRKAWLKPRPFKASSAAAVGCGYRGKPHSIARSAIGSDALEIAFAYRCVGLTAHGVAGGDAARAVWRNFDLAS
jgi:hypothetical protein